MDFPQKVFCGVFELPLLRNAQKGHKKFTNNKKERKERHLPTPFSGHLPDIRRFQKKSLRRPLNASSHTCWLLVSPRPCRWLDRRGSCQERLVLVRNPAGTQVPYNSHWQTPSQFQVMCFVMPRRSVIGIPVSTLYTVHCTWFSSK
jgi:hypothetical protein